MQALQLSAGLLAVVAFVVADRICEYVTVSCKARESSPGKGFCASI